MNYKQHENIVTHFLGKQKQIPLSEIKAAQMSATFEQLVNDMNLQQFVVLNQTHSAQGLFVDQYNVATPYSLYEFEGDFLVTQQKHCGLVVLTADCLPVVLSDARTQTIGIAHAGWKGSALGVVLEVLKVMQQKCGVNIQDIDVMLGPSASACCYEVSPNFIEQFEQYEYGSQAFIKRKSSLYFDNKLFMKLQLQQVGIDPKRVRTAEHVCTICQESFCSFRREKDKAGRQATVVALL